VVAEAQRVINEVPFSTEPDQRPSTMTIRPLPGSELPPIPGNYGYPESTISPGMSTPTASSSSVAEAPSDMFRNRQSQVYMTPSQQFNALPPIRSNTDESFGMNQYLNHDSTLLSTPNLPPISHPSTQSFTSQQTYAPPPGPPPGEVNEFGAYPAPSQFSPRSTSLRHTSGSTESAPQSPVGGPRGPRFATFPAKASAAPLPPRFQDQQAGAPPSSYAATQGLGERGPSLDIERRESMSLSTSIAQALGQEWASDDGPSQSPQPPTGSKLQAMSESSHEQWTNPPPRYSITPDAPSSSEKRLTGDNHSIVNDDDGALLAYAAPDAEDRNSRSSMQRDPHTDRHVRFGAVSEDDNSSPEQLAIPAPQESMALENYRASQHCKLSSYMS
jgi:hypothetical protein